MPLAIASAGEPMRTRLPRTLISPRSAGVSPKIVRASSERPAPTSPDSPTISPARTLRSTSLTPDAVQPTSRSSSTVSPSGTVRLGNTAASSRPTISWMSCSRLTSAISRVAIVLPSRSTVTRSAITGSSSSRCEM